MKKSFGKALALAMALCMVLSMLPMAVCAADELPTDVVNGNFEAEIVDGVVPGWTLSTPTAGYEKGSVKEEEGNHYLSLTKTVNEEATSSRQVASSAHIAVEPGASYLLSYKFKAAAGTEVDIYLKKTTGNAYQYKRFFLGSKDTWTNSSHQFDVPADAVSIYIYVSANGYGANAGYDDFNLIKLEEGQLFVPVTRWDILLGKGTVYTPTGTGEYMKDNGYAVFSKLMTSFDSLYHIPYDSTEANPLVSRGGITANMIENGTLKITNTEGGTKTVTIAQPYSANFWANYPVALAVDFKVDALDDGATFTIGMKDSGTTVAPTGDYYAATFSKDAADGKGYWRQAMTYDLSSGNGKRGLEANAGASYLTLTLSGNGTVYVDNFYFMSAPNRFLLNSGFEYLQDDATPAVWPAIRTSMVYTFHETEDNNYIEVAEGGTVPVSSSSTHTTVPFINASNNITGFNKSYFLPAQFKVSVDEKLAEGAAAGAGVSFATGGYISLGAGPYYTQAASATEWTTKSMNVLYTKVATGTTGLTIQCSDANYYLDNITVEKIEDGCKVYKDGAEVTGTLPAGNLTIEYTKVLTRTEGTDAAPINYFTSADGAQLIKHYYPSTYSGVARSEDEGATWLTTNIDAALLNGATANGAEASVMTAVYKTVDGQQVLDQFVATPAAGAKYVTPDSSENAKGITNVGILPTMASHSITLEADTDYEVKVMVWDGVAGMKPVAMYAFTTAAE